MHLVQRHDEQQRERGAGGIARRQPEEVLAPDDERRWRAVAAPMADGEQAAVDDEVASPPAAPAAASSALGRDGAVRAAAATPDTAKNSVPEIQTAERQVAEVEERLSSAHPAVPRQQQSVQCQRDRAGLRAEEQHGT